MIQFRHLLFTSAAAIALGTAPSAQTLVDDNATYLTEFTTLTKGMAAATLIWALNADTNDQSRALQAVLSAKISGGTDKLSARQASDFRTINNVDMTIGATPTHLFFTVQSPQENFQEVLAHTNEILRAPGVNENWLRRQNRAYREISSTRLRTPELLEAELTDYALFTGDAPVLDTEKLTTEVLRRPNQVVLNAQEYEFGDSADILLEGLLSFDASLNDAPAKPKRKLPSGIIHMPDEAASETLIFMGTIQEFDSVTHQAQTDTLYKYMGYGPGSEMFRIVRQEKRASYDPRSHFTQIGEQLAFTGLSATVPSDSWPEIHGVMSQIYNDTRAGKNTEQGLENSRNSMLNAMISDLRREPQWIVERYLELYPTKPPQNTIRLDLLNASFQMEPSQLNSIASEVLPDPSEFVTVIIGGAPDPTMGADPSGYCELPINESIEYCLDKLSAS
jgi:hypothetical protein